MRPTLAALVALVALSTLGGGASANGPAHVIVYAHGPKKVKIRLSVGRSTPCDASSNRQLYTGPINGGEELSIPFHEACACLEQTYEDFPDTGWGSPLLRCRPQVCINGFCGPDTSVPIYFEMHSKRPD